MLIIALFFVIAALLEGGCYLILRSRGLWPQDERSLIYNRAATGMDSWHRVETKNEINNIFAPHPYFGNTFKPAPSAADSSMNNYGFMTKEDYPYQKKPHEFVIGIFGGSTAMHWANFLETTNRWQNLMIANDKNAEVVVLNFAISGYRQPQQLIVGSKFFDTIDAAVVLDGWNESLLDGCPNLEPESPQHFEALFNPLHRIDSIVKLKNSSRKYRNLSSLLEKSYFVNSNFAYLIWIILQGEVKKDNFALTEKQSNPDQVIDMYAAECKTDQSERLFSIWKKYSNQMAALAKNQNIKLIHFLQPNPYVENAKPLGLEEREITHFEDSLRSSGEGQRSKKFRDLYLKNQPSNSIDLSYVFKNEKRIVYIDRYTHLNDLGYSLLSDRVVIELRQLGIVK